MTNEVANQPAARLWELFNVFAQIGLFTIGGGAVMLPFIQKAVVEDKRWLNDEEFADMLAITNSAPGAFTINASIYIGYTQRGLIGSMAAMLGMVTPSIVIILILAGRLPRRLQAADVSAELWYVLRESAFQLQQIRLPVYAAHCVRIHTLPR